MSDNIFNLAKNTLLHSFHNFEAIVVGFGKRLTVDEALKVEGLILDETEGLFIDLTDYLVNEQTAYLNGINTEVAAAAQVFTDFTFPIVQARLNSILGISS